MKCPKCGSENIGTAFKYNLPHCADCDSTSFEWQQQEIDQLREELKETQLRLKMEMECHQTTVDDLAAAHQEHSLCREVIWRMLRRVRTMTDSLVEAEEIIRWAKDADALAGTPYESLAEQWLSELPKEVEK